MKEISYKDLQMFLKGKGYKNKKGKWEKRYYIVMNNFKLFLMDLICLINGIDKDDILFKNGFSMKNIKFRFNKDFKNLSFLHFNEAANNVNGARYRGRYLTFIYFYFFKNADDIVDELCKRLDIDTFEGKYQVLEKLITKLNTFTVNFTAKNADYSKSAKELMEIFMVSEKSDTTDKVMTIFEQQGEIIKDACANKNLYDDDVIINNIIKLSYVTATGSPNVSGCPKFKEGVTYKNAKILKKQIRKLGKEIVKERRKRKRPGMYKAFTKAMPLYYSRFSDINEDYYLNVGTKALSYLKFLLNDKKCNKYIDSIIMN